MRLDLAVRRLPEGADLSVVTQLVAELDDAGDAAKMLQQADRFPKGLTGQVVDRRLAVIELLVGDVGQKLIDERLDAVRLMADGVRADLLVISDHHDTLAEGEGGETQDVTLTRFVENDHVELRFGDVEALHHPGQRHDPYRRRLPAIHQQLLGLGPESADVLDFTLTHLLVQAEPPG